MSIFPSHINDVTPQTLAALDWLVAIVASVLAVSIAKEPTRIKAALWLILFRGSIERGFDAAGLTDPENFMRGPVTRVPVYLIVAILILCDFRDCKKKGTIPSMIKNFNLNLGELVNRMRPEIETLAINGFLAVGDALILLAGSGQDMTTVVAFHAGGAALGSYLTSYYRTERAKITEEIVKAVVPVVAVDEPTQTVAQLVEAQPAQNPAEGK